MFHYGISHSVPPDASHPRIRILQHLYNSISNQYHHLFILLSIGLRWIKYTYTIPYIIHVYMHVSANVNARVNVNAHAHANDIYIIYTGIIIIYIYIYINKRHLSWSSRWHRPTALA